MGNWEAAAREMDSMLPLEQDPEKARDLLYLSAEYYEKAGNTSLAIERYRSYANKYSQPLGPRMEAMNRLTELYAARREPANRVQRFCRRLLPGISVGEAQGPRRQVA